MQDAVAQALVAKLDPILPLVGVMVVLGVLTFGSTILSLYWKRKEQLEDKKEILLESLKQSLAQISLNQAKTDQKLDMVNANQAKTDQKLDGLIERHDRDLQNLGNKIRNLPV